MKTNSCKSFGSAFLAVICIASAVAGHGKPGRLAARVASENASCPTARLAVAPERPYGSLPEGECAPEISFPAPMPMLKADFNEGEHPVWLYGNVTSTEEPGSGNLIGIYRYQINSSTPNKEVVHLDREIRGFSGNSGWTPDGYHLAVVDNDAHTVTHRLYDMSTWKLLREKQGEWLSQFNASAWDYRMNRQAVLAWSDSAWALHDLAYFEDMENFRRTKGHPLVLPKGMLRAMAMDTDGTTFAIDYNGILYTIDRHTGALSVVGNTGKPSPYDTSMYLDPLTHTLYYIAKTANPNRTTLYILDKMTAQPTLVWEFPHQEQIFGLYTRNPLAYPKAPATPVGLAMERTEASLSGSLTFTVPDTLYDGTRTSGDVGYTVMVDRIKTAEGKAACGARTSVDISVPVAGYHTFVVYTTNDAGDSPYAVLEEWIGQDYASTVRTPELTYSDGTMRLEWEPITTSQHGGFMPVGEVTYDVVRHPGDVAVATGIKDNKFSETISHDGTLKAYYYTVQSNCRDAKGIPTPSNRQVVGTVIPPFDFSFANEDDELLYGVIDADADGKSWQWDHGRMVCYYNPSTLRPSDDWLTTPAIKVEKGKAYKVQARLCGHRSDLPQKFEIKAGTTPSAEGMTLQVIRPEVIKNDNQNVGTYEGWLVPEDDGYCYLGLHAMGEAESYFLYLHALAISGPAIAAAPSAPSDFNAYTVASGEIKAKVMMKAPQTTVSGTELDRIDRIEVYRNDKLVNTIHNPSPGQPIEFEDKANRTGNYTYRAVAFNSAGEGLAATVKTYIGFAKPANVPSLNATFTQDGRVALSWQAPAVDQNGLPINPALVSYTVAGSDGSVIVADTDSTACILNSPAETIQRFSTYKISAKTRSGSSPGWTLSNPVPTGEAYHLPFVESASSTSLLNIWQIEIISSGATWGVADDSGSIRSQDADGGFMVFDGNYIGSSARLTSGKIEIGEESAEISCWYWADPNNSNIIELQINDGAEWTTVGRIICNHATQPGWNKAVFPLSDFKGKIVQPGILGTIVNVNQAYVDNLKIDTRTPHDMAVESFVTPGSMAPGCKSEFTITVSNQGSTVSGEYTVELMRDGETVIFDTASALAAGAEREFTFTVEPDLSYAPVSVWQAAVRYAPDTDPDNNLSEEKRIAVKTSGFPPPQSLCGEENGTKLTLRWESPDLNGPGEITQVTDGAESYPSFSNGMTSSEVEDDNMGSWTVYDGDGASTGIISVQGKPVEYPNSGKPGSFMVFDSSWPGLDSHWTGYGPSRKAFVCMYADGTPNDDWLISPVLPGIAQTVSFYAKSYHRDYPESFELLYSTTDCNPSSFRRVGDKAVTAPAEWTEYRFDLPEGARHFAIRCISDDKLAFMVDDIKFSAGYDVSGLVLTGYNVYREGKKLNTTLIPGVSYVCDASDDDMNTTYSVSAVYTDGESAFSNLWSRLSGVMSTSVDDIKILTSGNMIMIENPSGCRVDVWSASGIHVGGSDGSFSLPVEKGVYIVKSESFENKVIVK